MTKVEIIDAAFKAWGRSLYRNTSLSLLARELGVSKPALYRHFRDKQALMDAMAEHFFDDITAFIRPSYERALSGQEPDRDIFNIIRAITEYFARNVYAHVFSLINIVDRGGFAGQFGKRGIDVHALHRVIKGEYAANPLIMHMVFATLTFFMAHFHKTEESFSRTPSEFMLKKITGDNDEVISHGLGFDIEEINALDYADLEGRIEQTIGGIEDNSLLKAVAMAVAEAGPWDASMDMVARRSGLSKSSLYGHFKNRQDMLRQLFMTEFERIFIFSRQGIEKSSVSVEQLYLGVFSIAAYLRSRPEILVTMDWIRTRNLNLGVPEHKPGFYRFFEGIEIGPLRKNRPIKRRPLYNWILFLIISTLMYRHDGRPLGKLQNRDIRDMFRFLTLGVRGFKIK